MPGPTTFKLIVSNILKTSLKYDHISFYQILQILGSVKRTIIGGEGYIGHYQAANSKNRLWPLLGTQMTHKMWFYFEHKNNKEQKCKKRDCACTSTVMRKPHSRHRQIGITRDTWLAQGMQKLWPIILHFTVLAINHEKHILYITRAMLGGGYRRHHL